MHDLGIQVLLNPQNIQRLLEGLFTSFYIAFISIIASTILGIIMGVLMSSAYRPIRIILKCYLEFIRIMPTLVLLFIGYFELTKVFHIQIPAEIISIGVFTFWGTAEMGDLIRGAISSLPKHQKESGLAIGLSTIQVYRYIILPQILKRVLPSAINLSTRMIKTTSLIVLIGVVDILKVGQQIIEVSILKNPMASFWIYAFIFFLYFIICYPISQGAKYLEKRF